MFLENRRKRDWVWIFNSRLSFYYRLLVVQKCLKKCLHFESSYRSINQTWRNRSWCFGEKLEMEQNENLGESSENFQFPCSWCQQKFKTCRVILQHMRFCKENFVIDQGEGTGTIIDTEPDNEIKYREEIDNA